MDLSEALRRLEAARGDPNALALATVDIVLASREPRLGLALEAAAVPHWFDEALLRALLGDGVPEAENWFDELTALSIVERFRAHEAWNVHEVTRLALRDRLAEQQPDRFRDLSARAASLSAGDDWSHAIERVYHLLSADPDRGASDLRRLWRLWDRAGKMQQLQALGKALDELCVRKLLVPKARAHALVALGAIRADRIDLAAWEALAREAVGLMISVGDEVGLVDAHALLGRVLREQGHLADALSAYETARTYLEVRASAHPGDPEVADERADLHVGMGRTLGDRDQPREALAEFEALMRIRQRLCDEDPDDEIRRSQLAYAHADVGDALLPTARWAEAERYYVEAMRILGELSGHVLGPETIQESLGRLRIRLGDVVNRLGRNSGAIEQFEAAVETFRGLTAGDPEHFGWKNDLAQAQQRLALADLSRGEPDAADQRLTAARQIYLDLAEKDPANPQWKLALGELSAMFAALREQQRRWSDVIPEHVDGQRRLRELSEAEPDRAAWKWSLSGAQNAFGKFLKALVDALENEALEPRLLPMMVETLTAAHRTLSELVERDPGNVRWQSSLAWSERNLAGAMESVAARVKVGIEADLEISPDTLLHGALARYQSSASILAKLAGQAPHDTDFKRDLSISIVRAGAVLEKLARPDEALAAYRAAQAVTEELLRVDATNASWSSDLRSINEHIARLEGSAAAHAQ